MVVTPTEVIKIRLQAQHAAVAAGPRGHPVSNGAQILLTTVRTEGIHALYRGLCLTALRQGSNQAVSLSTYTYTKDLARRLQPQREDCPLPSWQTTLIGLLSGVVGPLSNHPIDTLKTRIQTHACPPGSTAWAHFVTVAVDIAR